ncbi:MAG: hypothetical protein IKY83_12280 [Proteobacteria bacterium]|nr:hypothetical protein [Pseudomonadota bacterium]
MIRFYFDYSDYRSYLMMHSLNVLEDLPVSVQWIAVDAYSLRALSGHADSSETPIVQAFRRREALRFCNREHLEFVWQSERIYIGSALHMGIWLMMHAPDVLERYSREVMQFVWGSGRFLDAAALREIVISLGVDVDPSSPSESENFIFQDKCLQEALSDGVFDVPALVIGDEQICHFDQGQEIRRLALLEYLRTLPLDVIYQAYAGDLLSLDRESFRAQIGHFTRRMPAISEQDGAPALHTIQHSLSVPVSQWHVPREAPETAEIAVRFCGAVRDVSGLLEQLAHVTPGSLSLCIAQEFDPVADMSALWQAVPEQPAPALFVICAREGASCRLAVLEIGTDRRSQTVEGELACVSLGGTKIALLDQPGSLDPHMARLAAHRGAHILVRIGEDSCGMSEAFGCISDCWIFEFRDHAVFVSDGSAHRAALPAHVSLPLATSCLDHAKVWVPPVPRTLLLCERSLTIGDLDTGANIELACRGMNLLVTTSQQSSELSATRVFEKLRVQDDNILILPVNGEQLFVTELISHRLVEAYNQGPRESLPIFVNYWSELEYEMLGTIRPVLSMMAAVFQIPVVFVVSNQVTEVWLSNAKEQAYPVEKDNDCFTIDTAERIRFGDCIRRMLDRFSVDDAAFMKRLKDIEDIVRGQQP